MLLGRPIADGVRDGRVTLAFRRWDAPRVKVGGTQLTAAGVIAFDAVDEVPGVEAITEQDANAAGYRDLDALRSRLRPGAPARRSPRGGRGGQRIYRIRLRYVGEDPRIALRERIPDDQEMTELTAAVRRLDDGRRSGPWTGRILGWIAEHPGVVSTELAELLGRELQPMKADIRRLKALGLTISLPVGYRLSPRGDAYLRHLESSGGE